MADYILSLATENQHVEKVDLVGAINILSTASLEDRTYVLKASYTDQRAYGMEPITASTLRMLQPPKLEVTLCWNYLVLS